MKSNSDEFENWIFNYTAELIEFLESDIPDTIDEQDKKLIEKGKSTESNIEIYGVSKIENWNLKVVSLDENCVTLNEHRYEVLNPAKAIEIIQIQNFYFLKKN